MTQAASPASPLAGVRVVEASTTFMGPCCATMLAHWGADVVKVESPSGDVLRGVGDASGLGVGPVFLNANRGKRSIAVDLGTTEGRELLDRLLADADVFIHNLRPAAARRLSLGPECSERFPRLVWCSFAGYGADGPYADRPAYDDVIQAMSGLAAVQGSDGSPPSYVRTAAADKIVAYAGAAAILAALYARATTGQGRAIQVPMFETVASFLLLEQQGHWVFDPPTGPAGYSRTASPHRRPFPTKDGAIAAMMYTDRHWQAFFALAGRSDLAQRPEFATITARTRHIDELYATVAAIMAARTTDEWERDLLAADVPFGRVNDIEDLFTDPHLQQVGFFEAYDDDLLGSLRLARSPIDMADGRPRLGRAPMLGEHSREVAASLGYRPDEIGRLVDAGVLTDHDG